MGLAPQLIWDASTNLGWKRCILEDGNYAFGMESMNMGRNRRIWDEIDESWMESTHLGGWKRRIWEDGNDAYGRMEMMEMTYLGGWKRHI